MVPPERFRSSPSASCDSLCRSFRNRLIETFWRCYDVYLVARASFSGVSHLRNRYRWLSAFLPGDEAFTLRTESFPFRFEGILCTPAQISPDTMTFSQNSCPRPSTKRLPIQWINQRNLNPMTLNPLTNLKLPHTSPIALNNTIWKWRWASQIFKAEWVLLEIGSLPTFTFLEAWNIFTEKLLM